MEISLFFLSTMLENAIDKKALHNKKSTLKAEFIYFATQ